MPEPIERPWDAPSPEVAAREAKIKRTDRLVFYFVGGAFGVLIVVGLVASLFVPKSTGTTNAADSSSSDSRKIDAWYACQEAMTARLKAPATAGYPTTLELNLVGTGQGYTTHAWVDSENGFGAQVRTFFTCTATDDGSGNFTARISSVTSA